MSGRAPRLFVAQTTELKCASSLRVYPLPPAGGHKPGNRTSWPYS